MHVGLHPPQVEIVWVEGRGVFGKVCKEGEILRESLNRFDPQI